MMFASFLTLILATGAPMEASGPEAQVADLVQADLPIDLAVVSVAIMGEASWSEAAQLQVEWPRAPRAGSVLVPVTVIDGGARARVWAAVKLVALRPVLVAARALAMGAVLEASDVRRELRPVASGEGLDLTAESLSGQAVLRDLEDGEVLGRRDVALPVPLPRGTPVTVVSTVGGARIEVQGVLASAARLGERGRVRVPLSPRLLSGRLVSQAQFQLEVSP